MLKSGKPYCDVCLKEMLALSEDEAERSGEPHGFPFAIAHEHYCTGCYEAMFDAAWKHRDPCGHCETQPCKRGRDCWFEPRLNVAYESYIADLVECEEKGGDT